MCLLNEEISAKDELIIVRMFKKHGFSLSYVGSEGQYIVTKLNDEGRMRVILILFELDKVVSLQSNFHISIVLHFKTNLKKLKSIFYAR